MSPVPPTLQFVDLLLSAYLLWGIWKGYRRKLGRELEALIKLLLLLAWVWGFGAFSWLRNNLDGLIEESPVSAGMLSSLLVLLLTFYLLYLLRERLAGAIESRISKAKARGWGAVAGLVRSAAWSAFLLLLLDKLPWIGDGVRDSVSGYLLSRLLTEL